MEFIRWQKVGSNFLVIKILVYIFLEEMKSICSFSTVLLKLFVGKRMVLYYSYVSRLSIPGYFLIDVVCLIGNAFVTIELLMNEFSWSASPGAGLVFVIVYPLSWFYSRPSKQALIFMMRLSFQRIHFPYVTSLYPLPVHFQLLVKGFLPPFFLPSFQIFPFHFFLFSTTKQPWAQSTLLLPLNWDLSVIFVDLLIAPAFCTRFEINNLVSKEVFRLEIGHNLNVRQSWGTLDAISGLNARVERWTSQYSYLYH